MEGVPSVIEKERPGEWKREVSDIARGKTQDSGYETTNVDETEPG